MNTNAPLKYRYLPYILLTGMLFLGCASGHKVRYNIPADYPDARKAQLIEMCNKGKTLYKIHCTECHGIFTKGKNEIPNFSVSQLDNYTTRFMRRDPKNHAAAINMSIEQLNEILIFLRYYKTKTPDTTNAAVKG